jgi:hypothetical protein
MKWGFMSKNKDVEIFEFLKLFTTATTVISLAATVHTDRVSQQCSSPEITTEDCSYGPDTFKKIKGQVEAINDIQSAPTGAGSSSVIFSYTNYLAF